ncbi:MAG TPA: response regulator transcription factor, partial [Bryobacteraceae bacterium]|nr:response regulator transcription factor [Bryobacteraceae bacterium]
MIRIVLADDHAVMRRGLRLVLEEQSDFTVAGEGNDGAEACALVEQLAPDVVILDITMPRLNGIEAAQQITSKHPRTAVLILSMHTDEAFVLRALKAGAKGYVLKESRDGDLIHAVRLAAQG